MHTLILLKHTGLVSLVTVWISLCKNVHVNKLLNKETMHSNYVNRLVTEDYVLVLEIYIELYSYVGYTCSMGSVE